MQFPTCRRPYPGELFYGYMRALCKMNDFDKMKELEHYFLSGGADNVAVNVSVPAGLAKICDVVENQTFPSLEEAIAMTPFYGMIDSQNPGQVAKLAETIIYVQSSGMINVSHGQGRNVVKICPDCWGADDKTYGESYLHVSHHLKGVKVCWKHKKPLISVIVRTRRNQMLPIEPKYGEAILIEDMEQDLAHAIESVEQMKHNKSLHIFQNIQCNVCGKHYVLPEWSVNTGAPCPYCSETMDGADFIQHRLDYRYPGEYRVIRNDTFAQTKVMHLVCEGMKTNLNKLLYSESCTCMSCMELTPRNLYRRYGTKDWIFYENSNDIRKRKRVRVKHKPCGKEFVIRSKRLALKEGGYCPYCENPYAGVNISDVDPEYEIVGDYQNNHDAIEIKHIRCGCVFKVSKTSFLAGSRCPICVPRYNFQDVVDAVEACTDGYTVSKGNKRGYVDIIHGSEVYKHIAYKRAMLDLKSEVPEIFKDKHTTYRDKRSVRKLIYDNVVYESLRKGYWEFADGLDGNEVTRMQRNLVQDLARLGYIHRISKGKYAITGGENT